MLYWQHILNLRVPNPTLVNYHFMLPYVVVRVPKWLIAFLPLILLQSLLETTVVAPRLTF
jgi:hypothetical protein